MSEPELIRQARTGDPAAWESLVLAHQTPVFRLAYLLLGDSADAEDVAQETFLRAYKALDSFDSDRPLRPWLLRIASNLASNRLRSLRRSLAALRRAFSGTTESGGDIDASAGWESRTLWQALRRLSRPDQEVIYLRYFLELSESEMARALDIAQGTVKSRLSRAMGRLRNLIDREFPDLRAEREL